MLKKLIYLLPAALCLPVFGGETVSSRMEFDSLKWTSSYSGFKTTAHGFIIRFGESSGKLTVPLKIDRKKITSHAADGVELAFTAERRSLISPIFADADGEWSYCQTKVVPQGESIVSWDFSTDVVGYSAGKNTNRQIDGAVKPVEMRIMHQGGANTLEMKSFALIAQRERKDCILAEAMIDREVMYIEPGEEEKLRFSLTNTASESIDFKLRMTLEAFDGWKQEKVEPYELGAGEQNIVPWIVQPVKNGFHELTWSLDFSDGEQTEGRTFRFTRMKPANLDYYKDDSFIYSINYASDNAEQARAAALIGCKVSRQFLWWQNREKKEGQMNWSVVDRMVDAADSAGMEIMMCLWATPEWAIAEQYKDKKKGYSYPPEPAAFRKLCREIGERYKGRIHLWEVWNEPDLDGYWKGTPEEYVEMMKIAFEELKAVDPDNKIICGGFASVGDHNGHKLNPAIHEYTIREGQQWMDYHGYHDHRYFEVFRHAFEGRLLEIRSLLKEDKPLYMTETAAWIGAVGRKGQAVQVAKKMILTQMYGARLHSWYKLRGSSKDQIWGMYDPKSGQPFPVYSAFNEIVRKLGGKKYFSNLSPDGNRYRVLFNNESEWVLASWQQDQNDSGEVAALEVGEGAEVRYEDLMGNPLPVDVKNGIAVFSIDYEPKYLVIHNNGTKPELKKTIFTVREKTLSTSGGKAKRTFLLNNPFSEEINVSWSDPFAKNRQTAHRTKLAPGESKTETISIHVPSGKERESLATCSIDGIGAAASIPAPVSSYISISLKEPMENKEPDFVLNQYSQLSNLNEADPSRAHLTWKGPKDCSAEIRLAGSRDKLDMRIDVTDDIHVQTKAGKHVRNEDSIQLIFGFPEQEGHWTFNLGKSPGASEELNIERRPNGYENAEEAITAVIDLDGNRVVYNIEIPLSAIGISRSSLLKGFYMNVIVNDCDIGEKEGYLALYPDSGAFSFPSDAAHVKFYLSPVDQANADR